MKQLLLTFAWIVVAVFGGIGLSVYGLLKKARGTEGPYPPRSRHAGLAEAAVIRTFLRRAFGSCPFGHSKNYHRQASDDGTKMLKVCPRCCQAYGIVLGEDAVKGPAHTQAPCAGLPTGRATPLVAPKPKVAHGNFR